LIVAENPRTKSPNSGAKAFFTGDPLILYVAATMAVIGIGVHV